MDASDPCGPCSSRECGRGDTRRWVAANAVVTRDVPDFAVVAGIPAKVVKYIMFSGGHDCVVEVFSDGGYEARGPVRLFLS